MLEEEYEKIIWDAHYIKVVCHFRIGNSTATLQRYFYYPKIENDVIEYTQECTMCVIKKCSNYKLGL